MVFTGWSHRDWAWARQRLKTAFAAAVVSAGLVGATEVSARQPQPIAPPIVAVALASLPVEAQSTYLSIRSAGKSGAGKSGAGESDAGETGGAFQYSKDGIVFGNRERLLPRKARGFYREYTVKTPGLRNRGARRIVCGGSVPAEPDACYYTDDHYASFRLIAQ